MRHEGGGGGDDMYTNRLMGLSPLNHVMMEGSVVAASRVRVLPRRASIFSGPGATRKTKSSGRVSGGGSDSKKREMK